MSDTKAQKPDPATPPGTVVESKAEATGGEGGPHPAVPENPSKAALVLAFQEVVNASAILAALIASDDSRGSTLNSGHLTGARCTK